MKFAIPVAFLWLTLSQAGTAFGQSSNGCIQPPVTCRVTSAYGPRIDPVTKNYSTQFHKGVDFGCPIGTSVLSADAGKVLSSGWSNSAGNLLIVAQGGKIFKYMHNKQLLVSPGQMLSRSQEVAKSGNTGGRTTGPHLHFQVEVSGVSTDPYAMLCSKPGLQDGVLQGALPDVHDIAPSAQTTAEAPTESSGSPFDAIGMAGSFREILQDAIGSRTFNADYQRQLMELSEVKLYSELSFINTLRLRIKQEIASQKERTAATTAMLLALNAEKTLKPQIEAQRGVATRAKE